MDQKWGNHGYYLHLKPCTDLPSEPVLIPPSEVESHCSLVTWRNSPDVSCEDISGYDVRLFNPDTKEEVARRVDARGTFHNFLLLDKDLTEQKSTTVQVYKCSYDNYGVLSRAPYLYCVYRYALYPQLK